MVTLLMYRGAQTNVDGLPRTRTGPSPHTPSAISSTRSAGHERTLSTVFVDLNVIAIVGFWSSSCTPNTFTS